MIQGIGATGKIKKPTQLGGHIAEVGDGGQEEPEAVLLLGAEAEDLHGAADPPPVLQRGHNLNLVLQKRRLKIKW